MRGRYWLLPVVLVAVAAVGVWSAQRLVGGKTPGEPMLAAKAPGAANAVAAKGDACCPTGEAAAAPAGKEGAAPASADASAMGGCPASAGHDHGDKSQAAESAALPAGHPPVEGMAMDSAHAHDKEPAHGQALPAGHPPLEPMGAAHAAAKDPVCGMDVTPARAKATFAYQGTEYYFCNSGCRDAFKKDPAKYL